MENLTLFEQKTIRQIEHNGDMYFSVVDIIQVLTDSPNPNRYWTDLKRRSEKVNGYPFAFCVSLRLVGTDGHKRLTDWATIEGIFPIIMSIPSPKAEPLKLWLANIDRQKRVGTKNYEVDIDQLIEIYRVKGYDNEWIEHQLKKIEVQKELRDEWKQRNVKEGQEFSILTATIAKETFGLNPSEHSKLKGLEKQNLRDNMTEMELIFTMLSESATRSIAVREDAQGFNENHDAALRGGSATGDARRSFEEKMGLKVVSSENFLGLKDGDKTEALE
jgi:DNA-damage-inducible protein D